MKGRIDMCGLHCPTTMLWLFTLHALWYVLAPLGIPLYGSFWSWLILLVGICTWACTISKSHGKTNCPFARVSPWIGVATTAVGFWFLLGDLNVWPTYGFSLLHVSYLLIVIGFLTYKKPMSAKQ